jgi:XTP/dITP diphosphohydrolase
VIVYACSINPGKLREFSLAARESGIAGIRILPLPELGKIATPEETGTTFEANAIDKARYYSAFTTELVFADDSGLEVDALNDEPGVYSARYAGIGASDAANNDRVLVRLGNTPDRAARFVCVIALARAGELVQTFHGEVAGEILHAARGDNGFGYDPLFFYPPERRAFGELTAEEKFRVSHRGDALRQMYRWLESIDTIPGK